LHTIAKAAARARKKRARRKPRLIKKTARRKAAAAKKALKLQKNNQLITDRKMTGRSGHFSFIPISKIELPFPALMPVLRRSPPAT
jgi:hypothetical protein